MFTQEQIQPTESIGTASKHPARIRNKEFLIRFTQEEFDELNYFVKKSGKTRADFILSLIQQDKIVIIDDLIKVWTELHRQGNNLNQIAKAMNTYCLLLQEFKTPEYDVDDYIKAFTRQLRSTQQEFNQLNLNHTELNQSSIEKSNDKHTESKTNNTLPINVEDNFKANPRGDDEHISEIDSIIYEANKRHNNQFSKSSKYEGNDTIEI